MQKFLERWLSTLRRKIAFALFIVMAGAGTAFVYVAQQTGYSMLEQQIQQKAKSITGILTQVLERVMVDGGKQHVRQALRTVTSAPDVRNAYLLKMDGSLTMQANESDTLRRFQISEFSDVAGTEGDKYLTVRENGQLFEYVVAPVRNKPVCATCHNDAEPLRGYIAVKLAVDDVRALAVQHRTTNLIMTLIIFASIGVIIYFALSVLIIRPIGTLHTHIKQVEGGIKQLEAGEPTTFPLLPQPTANDEISDLTRDVNNLVQRLNEGNSKLIELHRIQLDQAGKLASAGEMAASMAHEIKNPIAGVLGAVQVFESELNEDDPRKEIFSEMRVQLERVNHAVTDLLSFARPTAPVFEAVHVNDIIRRTQVMLSRLIVENNITVSLQLDDHLNSITADKKQIQQVIWNVMLNAVQAMESSGSLRISSQRENGSIKVIISDTGKGIPKEFITEMFKPFFTTKHKGTGLGMTITKRIVEQHKGTIMVESEIEKGTSVSLILPERQEAV